MKTLVLMSRMSDYMLNCFSEWQKSSRVDLHIVRMAVDAEQAPFDFSESYGGMTFYDREAMSRAEIGGLAYRLQPHLIICFGWFDPAYVAAVKARAHGTVAVMTMDNQWHGSIRQLLGAVYCRLFLVRHFDFVWVPGTRQRRFAHFLGFPDKKVREGLYVANEANFTSIYHSMRGAPEKRLVFVGRYVDVKGLQELWQSFQSYHATTNSDLHLLCIGTGPLYETRPIHPHITHLGFVQPKDFKEKLSGGGLFILPSKFEPWGVVVHEFAFAGFPLLLSRSVGAADRFLVPENGCLIDINRPESLQAVFAFVDGLNAETLQTMSEKSRSLGLGLSVADWCAQANEFLRTARP